MRKCHIYTTNNMGPILVMGYISHHIGRKWTIVKGSFYTHIISTKIVYDISIEEVADGKET